MGVGALGKIRMIADERLPGALRHPQIALLDGDGRQQIERLDPVDVGRIARQQPLDLFQRRIGVAITMELQRPVDRRRRRRQRHARSQQGQYESPNRAHGSATSLRRPVATIRVYAFRASGGAGGALRPGGRPSEPLPQARRSRSLTPRRRPRTPSRCCSPGPPETRRTRPAPASSPRCSRSGSRHP